MGAFRNRREGGKEVRGGGGGGVGVPEIHGLQGCQEGQRSRNDGGASRAKVVFAANRRYMCASVPKTEGACVGVLV
jgi:hypothetical protein